MLNKTSRLALSMIFLLIAPHSYAVQTPPPWVAIHVWIFTQPHEANNTQEPHVINPPSLPGPYQQLTLNIQHDQLPLPKDQNSKVLTEKLREAGYQVLYSTSWQQPSTTTARAAPHYLVDHYYDRSHAPLSTIPSHPIEMDSSQQGPSTNPTPIAFDTADVTPPTDDGTSFDETSPIKTIQNDATQRKLRDILPHAFGGPNDILDAKNNAFIKGTINLSLDRYYQATLKLYHYTHPDEPPTQYWNITQQLSTRQPNYLDHSQFGAIIQIKTIPSPIRSQTGMEDK